MAKWLSIVWLCTLALAIAGSGTGVMAHAPLSGASVQSGQMAMAAADEEPPRSGDCCDPADSGSHARGASCGMHCALGVLPRIARTSGLKSAPRPSVDVSLSGHSQPAQFRPPILV